jgi:hypothetical protein
MEDNSIGVCYFLKYFKNLNLKIWQSLSDWALNFKLNFFKISKI